MTYVRPEADAVEFSWVGESVYTRPASDAVRFSWVPEEEASGSLVSLPSPIQSPAVLAEIIPVTRPEISLPTPIGAVQVTGEVQYITPPAFAPTDIAATEAWSLFDEAYTVTWTWEHVAGLSGVTGYAGTLSYGLVVEPFTSAGKTVAFTGVPADTLLTFEVWAVNAYGIGPSETGPFTTGGLPPALVTGIGYTATVDSLTFYWDPAARADSYEARLYRDGALVELQEPVTEDAVFTGLEDGITYEVEVRGINAVSVGESGTREAITQYIAPTAPTNLRQEGSHWVLAQVYWDAPISKVTFYESIVLLDGDEVFKSIVPADPTERLFLLPKAGSTYQWKVRAGNPGGLSAFAEINIYTRGIEIDSRLAMLPACYQEDYLFPDTWDGGTDIISEGVGDPQVSSARMMITEGRYRFQPSIVPLPMTFRGKVDDYTIQKKLVVYDHQDPQINAWAMHGEVGDYLLFQFWPYIDVYPYGGHNGWAIHGAVGDYTLKLALFVYEDCCNPNAWAMHGEVGDYILEKP